MHNIVGSELISINLLVTNHFLQHPEINNEDIAYRSKLCMQLNKVLIDVREVADDLMPKDFDGMGIVNVLTEK